MLFVQFIKNQPQEKPIVECSNHLASRIPTCSLLIIEDRKEDEEKHKQEIVNASKNVDFKAK
jgi:hypothetical protein